MTQYFFDGRALKDKIKDLVESYMQTTPECSPSADGMRSAEIFRECGLDWDDQDNATSSQQQYWLVALLRALEKDGKVTRDKVTKRWRIV